jgi:hypothetical protein
MTFTLILLAVSAGCHSALSPRETRTQNFSSFVLSLYDTPQPVGAAPARVTAPIKVAVAQVGEVTPPHAMLDHLRKRPDLFARVEGIPGVFFDEPQWGQQAPGLSFEERRLVRERVARLQRLSRDLGVDYLFIFGGSIDHYTKENALQVLDLTIVGAFVAPSRSVKALGKAAGAMIDAHSGAVVFMTTADTEESELATATNEDGKTAQLLENTREALTSRLAKEMVERCREVALVR